MSERLASRLREISWFTFRACHCRDYARVDLRVDARGNPYVLEINSMASLGAAGSYVLAAAAAGYSLPELINRILDVAHRRCFGVAVEDSAGRKRFSRKPGRGGHREGSLPFWGSALDTSTDETLTRVEDVLGITRGKHTL